MFQVSRQITFSKHFFLFFYTYLYLLIYVQTGRYPACNNESMHSIRLALFFKNETARSLRENLNSVLARSREIIRVTFKRQRPFSYECQCCQPHCKTPRMIFSRPRPCRQIVSSYRRSAGAVCPLDCCLPSF